MQFHVPINATGHLDRSTRFRILSKRNSRSTESVHNEGVMVTGRDYELIPLSQVSLQATLQFLQVTSLRIRVVAHDHRSVLRKGLENVMVAILTRKVQIGVNSLVRQFHTLVSH